MRAKHSLVGLILSLALISGCTISNDSTATISVNSDSEYVHTFEDLNLGILYDFEFKLPNADKRWVNLWVEEYQDGEKNPQPISELSYGLSPNEITKGNIGLGIIYTESNESLVFLYAPGVKATPQTVDMQNFKEGFIAWDYALGDKEVELQMGETYLLAVYRQSSNNSIRTFDLQDESEIQQMINEDSRVFLLKIKVEEK